MGFPRRAAPARYYPCVVNCTQDHGGRIVEAHLRPLLAIPDSGSQLRAFRMLLGRLVVSQR